ncbi:MULTISPECIES: hypothetical protein [unclassified Streptomyces]|uniref:hypothetical protein n=1 Tax=unclassified Streptomyces TaxID=2593676 RepID=UPI00336A4B3A
MAARRTAAAGPGRRAKAPRLVAAVAPVPVPASLSTHLPARPGGRAPAAGDGWCRARVLVPVLVSVLAQGLLWGPVLVLGLVPDPVLGPVWILA